MKDKVLVVADDAQMLDFMANGLSNKGFDVTRADRLSKSLLDIQESRPKVVVADYTLQDGTAFDLLAWVKARGLLLPVFVLTAVSNFDVAIQAIEKGAEQFLFKPVNLGLLTTMLRRSIENLRFQRKDVTNKRDRERYARDPFLGTSPAIQKLAKAAKRAAASNSPVLIQGETGTGKGVLARWLHNAGPRANEAFVDLNCAGLSRELFESELFGYQKGAFTGALTDKIGFLEAANHGTVLLDEIGDMDLLVQPKILKVLDERFFYRLGDVQERKTDAQIIAATHCDLKKFTAEGKFRNDLYFRISVLRLYIPPLRERQEDIPIISDRILEQLSYDIKRGLRISDNARSALLNYPWPGNIRELRNVLERAVLLSDNGIIDRTGLEFDTPAREVQVAKQSFANMPLKEVEKRCILDALAAEQGNMTRTAKRLGIQRSSLYSRIHQYGL